MVFNKCVDGWLHGYLNYLILLYADDSVFSEAAEDLEKEACFQKQLQTRMCAYIYAMLKRQFRQICDFKIRTL